MVCKRVLRASMGDMGNSVAEILASMEWMAYLCGSRTTVVGVGGV